MLPFLSLAYSVKHFIIFNIQVYFGSGLLCYRRCISFWSRLKHENISVDPCLLYIVSGIRTVELAFFSQLEYLDLTGEKERSVTLCSFLQSPPGKSPPPLFSCIIFSYYKSKACSLQKMWETQQNMRRKVNCSMFLAPRNNCLHFSEFPSPNFCFI